MATKRWIGRAQAIAQVDTVTITTGGGWAPGDTITLTINDKDLVITIQDTTLATIATTIKEAWENETLTLDTSATFTPEDGGQDIIEHAEITATVSSTVVSLTHDTPGVPFTLTAATSGTGGIAAATGTAATGPNFWDNIDNWDTGSVPEDTDDVYIDNTDVSILWNIEPNLGAGSESLASLTIGQNFTGSIGNPETNPAGFVEYRPTYLKIEAGVVTIGRGQGSGSGRIKLDTDAETAAVTVENTGSPATTGLPSVLWKGTSASNTLEVIQGSVGVGALGGEAATLSSLRVTNGSVICGAGVTLSSCTVVNQSGSVELYSNVSAITNADGTVTVGGTATVGTLTVNGGTCDYQSSGTITTLVVGGQTESAVITFENANKARTVTNCTIGANGNLVDPAQTVTLTNDVVLGSDARSISVL